MTRSNGVAQCRQHESPSAEHRSQPHSAFWPAFWIAVASIVAKGVLMADAPGRWFGWLMDLRAVVRNDILFALWVGLATQVLLLLARRWPIFRRLVRGTFIVFGAFCAAWAAVHVLVYPVLRSPLTYSVIDVLGGITAIPRLIHHFLTQRFALVLASITIGYVLLVLICDRLPHIHPTPRSRAVRFSALVLLVAAIQGEHTWKKHWYWWRVPNNAYSIADSPHQRLIASLFRQMIGQNPPPCRGQFPPEDLADFAPLGPAAATHFTPNLKRGPRNVVLIVLESVGTRYLQVHGSPYMTTPRLAAEERHSLVLDNVYAAIGCSGNSMFHMVLGRYAPPSFHEYIRDHAQAPGTSMSGHLRQRGYRTAFFSSMRMGPGNCLEFLADRGFDLVHDARHFTDYELQPWGADDACLVDRTLSWIEEDRSRHFFVMLWNQCTHQPYTTPKRHRPVDFFANAATLPPHHDELNAYLNTIHYMDEQIGRLMDELRRRNLADDTIIIITGDHGETFGPPRDTFIHDGTLYQEDVSVPCILWSPRLFAGEHRRKTIGSHVDFNPTLADLLGIPSSPDWQGRSLFSPARPPRTLLAGSRNFYALGLREGNLKYILNTTEDRDEVYDLSTDPEEQTNIAARHAAFRARSRQRVATWLQYQLGLTASPAAGTPRK